MALLHPSPPLLLLALTATGNKSLGSEAAQNPQQHLIYPLNSTRLITMTMTDGLLLDH